jgi:hypothetical protein
MDEFSLSFKYDLLIMTLGHTCMETGVSLSFSYSDQDSGELSRRSVGKVGATSGAGNVSEPRLMSHVQELSKSVCA